MKTLLALLACLFTLLDFSAASNVSSKASKKTSKQVVLCDQKLGSGEITISKRELARLTDDPGDAFEFVVDDPAGTLLRHTWTKATVVNAEGGTFKISKRGHDIHSSAVSSDGTLFAIGYNKDNLVEIFNSADGKLLVSFHWDERKPKDRGYQRISDRKFKQDYAKEEIRDLAFSKNSHLLVAVSYSGEGIIYNLKTNRSVRFDLNTWSNGITFSEDEKTLYIGTREKNIQVVSVENGTILRSFGPIDGLNQSAGGKVHVLKNNVLVVLGSQANYVVSPKGQVNEIEHHPYNSIIGVDEESGTLVTSSARGFPVTWQIDSTGGIRPLTDLKWDAARTRYASSFAVNSAMGYAAGGISNQAPVPGTPFYELLPPEERLGIDDRGRVYLWDIRNGNLVARLVSLNNGNEDHTSVAKLIFDKTRTALIAFHASGHVYFFDLSTIRKSLPAAVDLPGFLLGAAPEVQK